MKITIELTDAEVKGLKHYLREVGDIENPTKQDLRLEIAGMISAELQAGAVRDYISKYE